MTPKSAPVAGTTLTSINDLLRVTSSTYIPSPVLIGAFVLELREVGQNPRSRGVYFLSTPHPKFEVQFSRFTNPTTHSPSLAAIGAAIRKLLKLM